MGTRIRMHVPTNTPISFSSTGLTVRPSDPCKGLRYLPPDKLNEEAGSSQFAQA